MADHSPGRVIYDADWRELKLEENGYVIATLPAPHPACRGKERAEEMAITRANGEHIAALWNSDGTPPHGDWLWVQLMDWCKQRKVRPSDYNDLFAIVGRARAASVCRPQAKDTPSASPSSLPAEQQESRNA